MTIIIAGEDIGFPKTCACCGDSTDQTYPLSSNSTRFDWMTTTTCHIPYCGQCRKHAERMELGPWTFLLFFLSLGFFYIQYRLIWRPLKEKQAKAMCKAHCTDIRAPRYRYDDNGGRHVFNFPSATFESEFVALNRDVIVGGAEEASRLTE